MASTKDSATKAAVAAALKAINSDPKLKSTTGDPIISLFGDKPRAVPTISTGSLVLNSLLGGGLAKGRVIEIYGPEASGKTSIALNAVADVQRNGGAAAFIDLEHALDPAYAEILGVDMSELAVSQPEYAEQALNLMNALIETREFGIIVLDSVAALVPKSEFEGNFEDQSIGLLARIMSKALRQLAANASKAGVTLIFINQIRAAVGGYSPNGTPETTTGGKALAFTASQRIRVSRAGQIKEGSEIIGNEVKFSVRKNKIAPPYRTGSTVLTFAQGINRPAEMIQAGTEKGVEVILRPNTRTYTEADTGLVLGTSKAAAIEFLEQNPDVFERISKAFAEAVASGKVKDKLSQSDPNAKSDDSDTADVEHLASVTADATAAAEKAAKKK